MPTPHHVERSTVHCAVITVSDTRNRADDHSGALIEQLLGAAAYPVLSYRLVVDEVSSIGDASYEALQHPQVEVVLINGGTGIAKRDVTIPALRQIRGYTPLPGFGELFRMLSYQQIGAAAQLSKAEAGVVANKVIYALPGSQKAVQLAMEQLIMPVLGHLVHELNK